MIFTGPLGRAVKTNGSNNILYAFRGGCLESIPYHEMFNGNGHDEVRI